MGFEAHPGPVTDESGREFATGVIVESGLELRASFFEE
jgi:hypothetical protein